MPNDEFGRTHFPSDARYFYLEAPCTPPSWEEYYAGVCTGPPVQLYACVEAHGFSRASFHPVEKCIPLATDSTSVRFQFSQACAHWDPSRHGAGPAYCMILKIDGTVAGTEHTYIPFDTDGYWYWVDVSLRELGPAGTKINVYAVTSVNGQDARGLAKEEYLAKRQRCGMGFDSLAAWETG